MLKWIFFCNFKCISISISCYISLLTFVSAFLLHSIIKKCLRLSSTKIIKIFIHKKNSQSIFYADGFSISEWYACIFSLLIFNDIPSLSFALSLRDICVQYILTTNIFQQWRSVQYFFIFTSRRWLRLTEYIMCYKIQSN